MTFFKRAWHKVKVLSHLNPFKSKDPLIRAFKWRIVWEYTKSEFGEVKVESSKKGPSFKVDLKVLIWPFIHPKPLEVYTHKICRLKAVISGSLDLEGLRCGSTFTLYHALLNKPFYTIHRLGLWCYIHFGKLYWKCQEIRVKRGQNLKTYQCIFRYPPVRKLWSRFAQENLGKSVGIPFS